MAAQITLLDIVSFDTIVAWTERGGGGGCVFSVCLTQAARYLGN